eukprot:gene13531-biopygen10799
MTNLFFMANKVEEWLESGEAVTKKLKHYESELEEKRVELKDLDNQILELLLENYEEEYEELAEGEIEDSNEYKENIACTIMSIKEALQNTNLRRSESEESLISRLQRSYSRESLASQSSNGSSQAKYVNVKLPKLELKKFNGKIHEWQEFWDGFCSAIHDNDHLANVDKFKYLKSFLDEPAKSVVTGMRITDASYKTAVDLLQKRYGKVSVIQRAHVNELINLPPVYNEKNVQRLRALHDQIETHFRGLQTIGVKETTYSSIVVPVLMEKVPENIRISMIRFNEKDQMDWTLGEMLGALEKEVNVRENHMPLLKGGGMNQQPNWKAKNANQLPSTAHALLTGSEKRKCVYCLSKDHQPEVCQKTLDERKAAAVGPVQGLEASAPAPAPAQAKDLQLNPSATSWVGSTFAGTRVVLQTALANVNGEKEKRVRVLFDTGSHQSFISAEAVDRLELKADRRESLGIKAFGKKESEVEMRAIVKIELAPLDGGESVEVECFVVNEIAGIANEQIESIKSKYNHLRRVYFSDVSTDEELEIDVLIGANYLWQFQKGETIRGGPQEPIAVKTTLGWVMSGPLEIGKMDLNINTNVNFVSAFSKSDKQKLEDSVHTLWDLDSLGIREQNEVHQSLVDNIEFTGERYRVGLPWKVGHSGLPTNYDISLMRLKSQLRKLKKDPHSLQKYDEIITEQCTTGIIERVMKLKKTENKVHYLAHQAVVREEAETTKVRIVFDASCKSKKTGTSLNDCLHVGPPLTPLIFEILLRFRENKVALVGDIEKAFLNIEIYPKDRDFLRFLWVDDCNAEEPELVVYRFNRVVFGVNSSPFLLNAVLRHHIETYVAGDPDFVSKLVQSFYVDDLVTGGRNTKEVISTLEKARTRMQEGGFRLRKWKTNNEEVSQKIAEVEGDESGNCSLSYAKEKLGEIKESGRRTKVLGIAWDMQKDQFQFELDNLSHNGSSPSKRSILSTLASLFDPLGVVSPVAVTAKILSQELCVDKLDWDDPLPGSKVDLWNTWLGDLVKVQTISIPRCVYRQSESEILTCQLHGFGDASKKAYCAVVYLVYEAAEGMFSQLLCSKTRVAPLKSLTIPRLELMSARILATLMNTVQNALSPQVKIDKIKYWLDSKTALYWIFNSGHWKQFVQHRVNEILTVSSKGDRGHVSGLENPADIGSRGVSASQLQESTAWWEGPQWLKQGEDKWPKSMHISESDDVEEEKKMANVLSVAAERSNAVSNIIDIGRISSLRKLLRVTAYVKRFVSNLKNKRTNQPIKRGNIEADEIKQAEMLWIKGAQRILKGNDDFHKTCMNLGIKENNGMLICQGRLENADLGMEARRGTPTLIVSDNAKTFKSTAALLKKLWEDQRIVEYLELKQITWKFNFERSQWWGGQFERMAGLVKRCLRKVLGNAKLSFDELQTVLVEIESTLNSRPLTYQYDELGEQVLTPSHLIFGRRLATLSEQYEISMNRDDEQNSLSRRFDYLTRKLTHFWNRWKREYLAGLRERHRSGGQKEVQIRQGDVVLIEEDNAKRGKWKVGVIEDLIKGKDGVTRGAKVRKVNKVKYEVLSRPVQKLYLLESAVADGEVKDKENERSDVGKGLGEGRPTRAAARDSRWKSRLMLDSGYGMLY